MALKVDPEVAKRLGFRRRVSKTGTTLFLDLKNKELLEAVREASTAHGTSMNGYIRAVMYLVCLRHYDRHLPLKELFHG